MLVLLTSTGNALRSERTDEAFSSEMVALERPLPLVRLLAAAPGLRAELAGGWREEVDPCPLLTLAPVPRLAVAAVPLLPDPPPDCSAVASCVWDTAPSMMGWRPFWVEGRVRTSPPAHVDSLAPISRAERVPEDDEGNHAHQWGNSILVVHAAGIHWGPRMAKREKRWFFTMPMRRAISWITRIYQAAPPHFIFDYCIPPFYLYVVLVY